MTRRTPSISRPAWTSIAIRPPSERRQTPATTTGTTPPVTTTTTPTSDRRITPLTRRTGDPRLAAPLRITHIRIVFESKVDDDVRVAINNQIVYDPRRNIAEYDVWPYTTPYPDIDLDVDLPPIGVTIRVETADVNPPGPGPWNYSTSAFRLTATYSDGSSRIRHAGQTLQISPSPTPPDTIVYYPIATIRL